MAARIRELREVRGWSQQELADRAGVTRQLVGAVEAARHVPNVVAAMALARALDTTVEELFERPAAGIVPAFGATFEAGTALLTATLGEHVVAVPVPHGAVNPERWTAADAEAGPGGRVERLPGGRIDGLLVSGCDPVLGLVAELVERSSPSRVIAVLASTGRSIRALAEGTVHAALVHAAAGELPEPPVPVRRWHVARWLAGLAAIAPGGPPPVEDLAARRSTVVQRDGGAGTQQALQRALRVAGATDPLPGPIGEGHLDVARRVLAGGAGAGVTMEAAALAFGLGFRPLEEHAVELWLDERWSGLAAAAVLSDVLGSEPFLRRVGRVGGYDLAGCGTSR